MSATSRTVLVTTALFMLMGFGPVTAQSDHDAWCDEANWNWTGWRRAARHCEVREMRLETHDRLDLDAAPNGSIHVEGWDEDHILVVARVQAWARDEDEAARMASEVEIRERDGRVNVDGPRTEKREGWSASFRIFVPEKTRLELEAMNGSIEIERLQGEMLLRTLNGSIQLTEVGGDVRGRTTNGSVKVRLSGDSWQGDGLDVATTNGSVQLAFPDDYNARLQASTVNGKVRTSFPVTMRGRIDRRIDTQLGNGGALIEARTTNGSVRLSRR